MLCFLYIKIIENKHDKCNYPANMYSKHSWKPAIKVKHSYLWKIICGILPAPCILKHDYQLRANNGVEAVWCTPYESVGAKVSGENDKTTGGGLAWGGGCSPSLTPELVMFTDNADPVKLLALDMKTGKIVASLPVLDDLPEGYQVAVENSAIVYDDSEGTVSTIVCNWFGAGSAGLPGEKCPHIGHHAPGKVPSLQVSWLLYEGNCVFLFRLSC